MNAPGVVVVAFGTFNVWPGPFLLGQSPSILGQAFQFESRIDGEQSCKEIAQRKLSSCGESVQTQSSNLLTGELKNSHRKHSASSWASKFLEAHEGKLDTAKYKTFVVNNLVQEFSAVGLKESSDGGDNPKWEDTQHHQEANNPPKDHLSNCCNGKSPQVSPQNSIEEGK